MVVPVLMTSCQVSQKPNIGPDAAHMTMAATATTKVIGRPVSVDTPCAKATNQPVLLSIKCLSFAEVARRDDERGPALVAHVVGPFLSFVAPGRGTINRRGARAGTKEGKDITCSAIFCLRSACLQAWVHVSRAQAR